MRREEGPSHVVAPRRSGRDTARHPSWRAQRRAPARVILVRALRPHEDAFSGDLVEVPANASCLPLPYQNSMFARNSMRRDVAF